MSALALIVAMARNRVIGKNNALPWHLPEDLQHFKRTTLGAPIIMGRHTWASIGRPLPGRRNIVLSRNPTWQAEGAERAASLEDALALCRQSDPAPARVFVIGGAQLYAQALPLADELFMTEIEAEIDGDAYFPPIDAGAWHTLSTDSHVQASSGWTYRFIHLTRRQQTAGR